MMTLDFKIDEIALATDLEFSPETADPAVLETTYFEMPVRFAINGVELLQFPGNKSRTMALPLLNLASFGRARLSGLGPNTAWTYELPGGSRLSFVRTGNLVTIRSGVNQGEGSVAYSELLQAWDDFYRRVKSFLVARVPKLQDHPMWNYWTSDPPIG